MSTFLTNVKPSKGMILSGGADAFPNFKWLKTVDPGGTPPEQLIYDLEITDISDASFLSVVKENNEIPDRGALSAGSYLMRYKTKDASDNESQWSDSVTFIIRSGIDPAKIYITTPVFEDPKLGGIRFQSASTVQLWNRLKDRSTLLDLANF